MITIPLDTSRIDDYRKFLRIKSLPVYSFVGSTAYVPDEYASRIGLDQIATADANYSALPGLFDYQSIIAGMAIRKRKFAVFADCGLGKTLILLEYAKHVRERTNKKILIVSPLMVIRQTLAECAKFYGDTLRIEQVRPANLNRWMECGESQIGITNYESMNDAAYSENLGAMILDESSMLKSHYGSWAGKCIELGRGLDWKLCLTGTPAPNDRIEYANHAVFLDRFPNVNSFLATFFVNRGQTDNRWELKPHALNPFYQSLADWSIFLVNPTTYGWKGSGKTIPPINVEIHHVGLTPAQRDAVQKRMGSLFAVKSGGIVNRSAMSQISKGRNGDEKIDTLKPPFIADLVRSWPDEQSLIWCWYNHEQDTIREVLPEAGSISGDTSDDVRIREIESFQAGSLRSLISKPRILGFGLNLQCATRQVFSGLVDSYEAYYQAVKRSNRYGATRPLNVHIPITELEAPMVESVLRKCKEVQRDSEEQERIFRDAFIKQ